MEGRPGIKALSVEFEGFEDRRQTAAAVLAVMYHTIPIHPAKPTVMSHPCQTDSNFLKYSASTSSFIHSYLIN